MRTLIARLAVVMTAGLALAAGVASPAAASASAYGNQLMSLINDARSQHGLPALTVTSGTSTVASAWTQHMADNGALAHNPDLQSQLESHGSADWHTLGENVGEGDSSSPRSLFDAYMKSPEHRSNILGADYRYVGVGVVITGGTAWNTLDFVDEYAAPASRTARPATAHASPNRTHAPTAGVLAAKLPARRAIVHLHAAPGRPRKLPTVEALTSSLPSLSALAPAPAPAIHTPSRPTDQAGLRAGDRGPDRERPVVIAIALIALAATARLAAMTPARRMTHEHGAR